MIEVFPGYALVVSFDRGKLFSITAEPWGLPIYFFWFVSIVALFILLQLLYLDVAYAIRSMERILSGHAKKKQKGEKTKRR